MVAPIEQRFNAAVNVIRGLPKHGECQGRMANKGGKGPQRIFLKLFC